MFDGVPDQFHQFITPTTRTSPSSLPLHHHHHLPFPTTLHPNTNTNTNNNNNTFPTPFVDPYNNNNNPSHHHQFQHNNNLLHPAAAAAPLHPPHHHSSSSTVVVHNKHEEKEENNNNTTLPMNFEIERDHHQRQHQHQQLPELIDPSWSNEEVLTLLRIRSSMESWFPELTWEHVSRKMAEVGYKRSAEKCKEKFEEESRFFTNNINNNNNNNYGKSSSSSSYRFLSELEELYHHHEVVVESEKNHHQQNNNPSDEGRRQQQEEEVNIMENHALEGAEAEEEDGGSRKVNAAPAAAKDKENEEERTNNNNKRKRGGGAGRFEMFKGFCESIVHKMMEQQEEMHNKLIEDMVRWDEEKFAREEAWKRQEIERMNKELEIMAQEQAIAGDRQAGIIDFLRKFASEIQALGTIGGDGDGDCGRDKLVKVTTNVNGSNINLVTTIASAAASELHSHQNPNPSTMENSLQPTNSSAVVNLDPISVAKENPSSSGTHPAQDTLLQASKNPSSTSSLVNNDPIETNSVANKATTNRVIVSSNKTTTEKDDIGRRWPKDEVLALINLRCTTQNNNNNEDNNNKEGNNNNKAPLWERISQGMMELGYKRSAKRCKEKWENINKYFRKTKDVNKKRSLDSRTCPYFHHLSNLYSQGKLALQPPERSQEIIPAQINRIPSEPPPDKRQENYHGNVVVIDNNQKNQTHLLAETTPSQMGSGGGGGGGFTVQQVDHGGEKTLMQVPSLDFDQF